LNGLGEDLAEYLKVFRNDRIDGFIWAVRGECRNLTQAASLFARSLAALTGLDPLPPATPWSDIETTHWQFSYLGERLFLNVFSNCYPISHSKHLDSPGGIVIFAQPEDAFDFCGIDPSRKAVKESIRERFRDAGMPYSGELIDRRIESLLYVFPAAEDDEPVRFWEGSPISTLIE
jgi:hypothetical protein